MIGTSIRNLTLVLTYIFDIKAVGKAVGKHPETIRRFITQKKHDIECTWIERGNHFRKSQIENLKAKVNRSKNGE